MRPVPGAEGVAMTIPYLFLRGTQERFNIPGSRGYSNEADAELIRTPTRVYELKR